MLFRVFINYHEVDSLKISFNDHVGRWWISKYQDYSHIKCVFDIMVVVIVIVKKKFKKIFLVAVLKKLI
jgi:hypothetical protein